MPQLGLIALLVAELLYLTVRFDSQALDQASSPWLQLVAWSPQYLRLAVTVSVVMLLLKGKRLASGVFAQAKAASPTARVAWLAVHLGALLLFVRMSAMVFDPVAADRHAALWVGAWFLLGAAALRPGRWPLRLAHGSLSAERPGRALAGLAVALGSGAWISGFLTEALWRPLARYTFSLVGGILGLIYPHVVSNPAKLIIGTPTFKVAIAPQCSGYEGVGLLLAFLTFYLWLFRRELRFPGALVMLPLGAAAIWLVNALRIVVLIIIGTSGWPAIALGGFHSQAGWLAFNAVGLAFVAILNRGRFFMTSAETPARRA